ncbi:helix-turn-helix domain-containing protein [Aestuariirhabdus haliotis]|uniref:helix-turn-helix domain-containing protein n=1 Tax=Aestuariirhabdus haliotis TaxID=2918751 RepID=UPI00387378A8
MKYRQITSEERYTFSALRKERLPIAKIARILGRHRSTIYPEVQRNLSPRKWCYRPFEADSMARGRR